MECDHSNDQDVEKLFTKIKKEQDGRLDILVNNAFAGVNVSTFVLLKYSFLYIKRYSFRIVLKRAT